jgi:hypothetical protein
VTSFHASERFRMANGFPCWLGWPVVLPDIRLKPVQLEDQAPGAPLLWRASLLAPDVEMGFSWKHCELPAEDVQLMLEQWQADPEGALETWFGYKLPERPVPVYAEEPDDPAASAETAASAEDLGL